MQPLRADDESLTERRVHWKGPRDSSRPTSVVGSHKPSLGGRNRTNQDEVRGALEQIVKSEVKLGRTAVQRDPDPAFILAPGLGWNPNPMNRNPNLTIPVHHDSGSDDQGDATVDKSNSVTQSSRSYAQGVSSAYAVGMTPKRVAPFPTATVNTRYHWQISCKSERITNDRQMGNPDASDTLERGTDGERGIQRVRKIGLKLTATLLATFSQVCQRDYTAVPRSTSHVSGWPD